MRLPLVAALVVLCSAGPALASSDGTLAEIPPGQTLYARADTLDALQKATAPTLTLTVPVLGHDRSETLFLWTARAADGTRRFSLATVYPLQSRGGKLSYVIFNPGNPASYIQPRITTALDAKRDRNDPLLSPARQTQSLSALVASVHPEFGTLYQLSLDRPSLDTLKHDERRIFVMHDPDHGWRYVGQLGGNRVTCSDSVDYTAHRHVDTTIAWTGVPDAPVRITCQLSADYQLFEPAVAIAGTYSISGTLPAKARDARFALTIQKGHTFTGIAQGLADWHGDSSSDAGPSAADFRLLLLALNPGLNPNRLRAGDTLVVPDIYAPLGTPSKRVAAAK